MVEPPRAKGVSLWRVVSGPLSLGRVELHGGLLAILLAASAAFAGYAIRSPMAATTPSSKAATPQEALSVVDAGAPLDASASPGAPEIAKAEPPRDRLLERLKTLEAKPARERSVDESVELARGHQHLAASEIASLERTLEDERALDGSRLGRLRELARDDALAVDVLDSVARHPRPAHADFLYDVATDQRSSETVRYLASDLLAQPAVRAAVSNNLAVVLDLTATRQCDAAARVIARAKTSGDDRALPLLRAFDKEQGCGKDGKEDCFPCLRHSTLLYEAREAAAARVFSPPWISASR